jgi:hypothetical protein
VVSPLGQHAVEVGAQPDGVVDHGRAAHGRALGDGHVVVFGHLHPGVLVNAREHFELVVHEGRRVLALAALDDGDAQAPSRELVGHDGAARARADDGGVEAMAVHSITWMSTGSG